MLRVAQLLGLKTVALMRTVGLGGDGSKRRVSRGRLTLRLHRKVAPRRVERMLRMGSLQSQVLESVHRRMRTG